jgi:4-amino-4-deoxy-L-arabinose transferase-like glycosyltransferase
MGDVSWRSGFWRRPPLWVFLYGVASAALFAFVIYPRQGLIAAGVDLNGFGELARNLANGQGFSLNFGPTIRRAPLFPALGAVLLTLGGSDATAPPDAVYYRPILIGNCIIFGFTCLVVYKISSSLFGSRVALIAVALCPLFPQSLRYVGMTEVETFMGLLFALSAWTGIQLVREPSLARGIAFGAVLAAATLSKPVTQLYPFLFVPLAYLHWKRAGVANRVRLVAAGAALGTFLVLLAPWVIRNAIVTDGRFKGISGNAPGEFLRGYINAQSKYFLLKQNFGGGEPQGEKWDPEANLFEQRLFREAGEPFYHYTFDASGKTIVVPTPPPGTTSIMLELEKDRVEGNEAKRRLREEPLDFVRKAAIQTATFWYIVETKKKSLLVGAIALVTLGLCALGFLRARARGAVAWPVVTIVVYVNLIYAAILAFARYSMPLYPTLISLAAGGVAVLIEKLFPKLAPFVASPRTNDAG